MATIAGANRNEWPKNFYDTGGGSFGLVQANKLQTGVVVGNLQIGSGGPILSGSTQQIIVPQTSGAPIIINSSGITGVGGGSVIIPADDYIEFQSEFGNTNPVRIFNIDRSYFSAEGILIKFDPDPNVFDGGDDQLIGTDGTLELWAGITNGSGAAGPVISLVGGKELILQTMRADHVNTDAYVVLSNFDNYGTHAIELADGSITHIAAGSLDQGISLLSTGGVHIHTVNNTRYANLKVTNIVGIKTFEFPNAGGTVMVTTGTKPTTSASSGVVGQIEFDTGFIYICIAANTWRRVATTTF